VRLSLVRSGVFAAACTATAVLCMSSVAAAAPAPKVDVSNAKRCDFLLGGTECLAPFPNDYFTVADKKSHTGRRVHLALASMPANSKGVHIDPQWW